MSRKLGTYQVPGAVSFATFYTTKHHSGVVMSDSTVEMAVHLLAKVESAPYFSARMVVVPPIGIPARTTATPVAS